MTDTSNRRKTVADKASKEKGPNQKVNKKTHKKKKSGGLLCCVAGEDPPAPAPVPAPTALDRVERAFQKFDLDGDGYLDWEEWRAATAGLAEHRSARMFNRADRSWPARRWAVPSCGPIHSIVSILNP